MALIDKYKTPFIFALGAHNFKMKAVIPILESNQPAMILLSLRFQNVCERGLALNLKCSQKAMKL